VACAAVAADLLETLDVEADLLLQRGTRALAGRVVGDARGVELAPDVLTLRLAHTVQRVVPEDADRGGELLTA